MNHPLNSPPPSDIAASPVVPERRNQWTQCGLVFAGSALLGWLAMAALHAGSATASGKVPPVSARSTSAPAGKPVLKVDRPALAFMLNGPVTEGFSNRSLRQFDAAIKDFKQWLAEDPDKAIDFLVSGIKTLPQSFLLEALKAACTQNPGLMLEKTADVRNGPWGSFITSRCLEPWLGGMSFTEAMDALAKGPSWNQAGTKSCLRFLMKKFGKDHPREMLDYLKISCPPKLRGGHMVECLRAIGAQDPAAAYAEAAKLAGREMPISSYYTFFLTQSATDMTTAVEALGHLPPGVSASVCASKLAEGALIAHNPQASAALLDWAAASSDSSVRQALMGKLLPTVSEDLSLPVRDLLDTMAPDAGKTAATADALTRRLAKGEDPALWLQWIEQKSSPPEDAVVSVLATAWVKRHPDTAAEFLKSASPASERGQRVLKEIRNQLERLGPAK
jgi:hypothetical protein